MGAGREHGRHGRPSWQLTLRTPRRQTGVEGDTQGTLWNPAPAPSPRSGSLPPPRPAPPRLSSQLLCECLVYAVCIRPRLTPGDLSCLVDLTHHLALKAKGELGPRAGRSREGGWAREGWGALREHVEGPPLFLLFQSAEVMHVARGRRGTPVKAR